MNKPVSQILVLSDQGFVSFFQSERELCQYAFGAWSKHAKQQGQTKDPEHPCSGHLEVNSQTQAAHTASCQSKVLDNHKQ